LLPKMRQTLFFSATMAPEIRRLSDAFLQNPKEVTVAPKSRPVTETVTQGIVIVDQRKKGDTLRQIIAKDEIETAIIFCNRKRDVDTLGKSLKSKGLNAAALHGDMDQTSRNETLERFKDGKINFLVASDVAARGLDIDDLPAVFNYDVPMHAEDYIHRIGRTGRAGRSGAAYTLATPADGVYVDSIEKLIGNSIPRLDIDGVSNENLEEGDGKKRGRSRRGGGRSQRERAPKAAQSDKPRQEKPAERPSREERSREEKSENEATAESRTDRSGEKSQARSPRRSNRDRPKKPEGENKPRDRGNQGRKEKEVVGLGDHVPAFLQKPARPS
jgi:superfamily II DNA/RNA helicase